MHESIKQGWIVDHTPFILWAPPEGTETELKKVGRRKGEEREERGQKEHLIIFQIVWQIIFLLW